MINIDNALKINGWMFESELTTLAIWASKFDRIVEVGSWYGRSTMALCDNTEGLVFAVDHWKGPKDIEKYKAEYSDIINYGENYVYKKFKQNLKPHILSGKLNIIKKSSILGAKHLMNAFGDNFFNMVFIDCDHTYEYIHSDIVEYLKLLQPGSLICGHDFNWPGVEQAVKELLPDYKLRGNIWYKYL